MTKLDGKTPDLAAENIEQLRQIFPDVFEEGKIDFDKLKQVLGEYVDDEKERYNFTWNGKGKALRLAQTPTTGTLRPCEAESKNWDDTQNLYIEGDNLEVLKLLQKSYHGKIKMIYIDKTTPRLIQFHTLKNAVNPPFLGGFLISGTVAA